MARNEEKAQSMLNRFDFRFRVDERTFLVPFERFQKLTFQIRWLKMKQDKTRKPSEKRPFIASECKYLPDAEKWRQEVIKEIIRDVALVQNESSGEYRIRELNDNINKRLREKHHWETRIAELGGKVFFLIIFFFFEFC
jgi:pre-mRNA-splicing factor ISY1